MNEIIQDIRKKCRMAMNGIASTSMREKGLVYKLNFGVSLPKIKEIAQQYSPNKELSEELWIEDTRELKILATQLFPIELFSEGDANRWAKQIPNQEIREQITINLYQKLAFADKLAMSWMKSDDENIRATGYWLFARLCIVSKSIPVKINLDEYKYLFSDLNSDNLSLRNATILFLKNIGKNSQEIASWILLKIATFKNSESALKKEIYNSLSFEFNYAFEK